MLSPASLRFTAARYALGLASGEDLIRCADALLDRGVYTYSLGELWSAPTSALRDIGPLFEAALRELDHPQLSGEEAVRTLLWNDVVEFAEGACVPRKRLALLWKGYFSLQFDEVAKNIPEVRQLLHFTDDYNDLLALGEEGFLDRDQVDHRLAELDRQVTEFACRWCRQFCPVRVEPSWLTWDSGAVRGLAQALQDERAFDRLPILADALEEAGCSDAELLSHLRGPGPHTRSCWLVDRLFGQE
jgi:hypothetical protein